MPLLEDVKIMEEIHNASTILGEAEVRPFAPIELESFECCGALNPGATTYLTCCEPIVETDKC